MDGYAFVTSFACNHLVTGACTSVWHLETCMLKWRHQRYKYRHVWMCWWRLSIIILSIIICFQVPCNVLIVLLYTDPDTNCNLHFEISEMTKLSTVVEHETMYIFAVGHCVEHPTGYGYSPITNDWVYQQFELCDRLTIDQNARTYQLKWCVITSIIQGNQFAWNPIIVLFTCTKWHKEITAIIAMCVCVCISSKISSSNVEDLNIQTVYNSQTSL